VNGDGRGPEELLALAGDLLRRADPATRGLWPRASSLLARQALEDGVRLLWERQALDLRACSMRTQLICLRSYLGDAELASRVGHAWAVLSRASHHHAYELAPTAGELQGWFTAVTELLGRFAVR
jgi:hypothetical protein